MKIVAKYKVEIEITDNLDRRPAEGDILTDTQVADIIRQALYDLSPFYFEDIHCSVELVELSVELVEQ